MARKESQAARRAALRQLGVYQAMQDAVAAARARRKRDNVFWGFLAGAVVAIAVLAQVGFTLWGSPAGSSSTPSVKSNAEASTVPSSALAEGKIWQAELAINNIALPLELDGAAAPQAVSSTLSLSKAGFYNNLTCHRLTTDGIFVLQCGDPKGDGSGGPGYNYGPVENAPASNIYPAGTIAMARQGNNASSQGSQFFIVYKDSQIPADSAGGYTVIGHIKGGLDQLKSSVIAKGVVGGATDGPPAVQANINYFNIIR